jgi:hypothetical protein
VTTIVIKGADDHRRDLAELLEEHSGVYASIAGAAAFPGDVRAACEEARDQLAAIRAKLTVQEGT